MTTPQSDTPQSDTPQSGPQSTGPQADPAATPLDRVAKQRLADGRVHRVRKIRELAGACKDDRCEAIVSFGMMGVGYPLDTNQSRALASMMLTAALDEHAADAGADPLPSDLEWVMEIAGAAAPKSPSMQAHAPQAQAPQAQAIKIKAAKNAKTTKKVSPQSTPSSAAQAAD